MLNKEVVELDWNNKGRTVGDADIYNPEESEEVDEKAFEGGTFVLGGRAAEAGRPMREVLAEAAILRLTKEEKEIMESCGSGSSSDHKEPSQSSSQ